MNNIEDLIFGYVRLIPLGRVTTQTEIARALGDTSLSRVVSNSLKKVLDVDYIPSHRVVSNEGRLLDSFVDGGKRGQRRRLINEGLLIKGNKVSLDKYGFYFW